jgi:hypothetical protein
MIRAPCQTEAHILPADLIARVEVMCHHNVCANTATHVGRLKRCVTSMCVDTRECCPVVVLAYSNMGNT